VRRVLARENRLDRRISGGSIMATAPVSQALNRGGSFLITKTSHEDIFTPADLTDDQRLIGQTAEEFMQKEVIPAIPELEAHKDNRPMVTALKKAGEIGLLGGGIPEAYGGAGLDKISATILAEKLATYGSFAVSHGGHSGIGTVPIVYFGTEEQKKKYLPKIASGELLSSYCLSEPQAGSDSLASRTRAVLSPDG
jgi:alkylation response protein AidB-like acyl-CoA dehydrogenase